MNKVPRLSIGLPVYNGEEYLAESLDALLGQTYEDFEIIISDNASTDSTGDMCKRYARQDSRIRYVLQSENIGLARNHDFVFRQSRGELFKWAAADDLYGQDLFQRCVDALDEYPQVVLAHAWEAAIDASGTVTQAFEYPLATDSDSAPKRFRSILFGSSGLFERSDPDVPGFVRKDNQGILRACDEYGVIRADVMRRIAPHASYHHSDRVLVCELALHGPFHMTPEWLYFRRDFPDRTYNKNPSVHGRCAILDPKRASRVRHPSARLVAEYLLGYVASIRRAPLSSAERRECYQSLAEWILDRATSKVFPRPLEPVERQMCGGVIHSVSVQAAVAGQGNRP